MRQFKPLLNWCHKPPTQQWTSDRLEFRLSRVRHMTDLPKARELRIETCHAKAAECRLMAKLAKVESHAIMLEHMAQTWERIAAELSGSATFRSCARSKSDGTGHSGEFRKLSQGRTVSAFGVLSMPGPPRAFDCLGLIQEARFELLVALVLGHLFEVESLLQVLSDHFHECCPRHSELAE